MSERACYAGRTTVRIGGCVGVVFLLHSVSVEANRAPNADERDPADSLDRLFSVWLGVGLAQALSQGETCKPGRLMGTVTISVPYCLRSSLNFAAFPSTRNVAP